MTRKFILAGFAALLFVGPGMAQEPTVPGPELQAAIDEMINRPATPYVLGAVRIDFSRLVVSPGRVTRGQAIFSGTAGHAQVGRLAADMNLRDALQNFTVPAGTPLYLVEFVRRRRIPGSTETVPGWSMTAAWCGSLGRKTVFGTASPALCIIDNDPAQLVLPGRPAFTALASRAWLTTSPAALPASLNATNFAIEPVGDDPFGAMDLRLELSSVRPREVRLTLFASQGGDDMVVMRFAAPVEAGVAVLPMWGHRLRLQVERNAVTPSLTADGDGSGPIPLGAYPSG